MKRIRTIPLLVVLFIATVLMLPMAAGAATSDRTLPASVDSGVAFTVSMIADDYGLAGSVIETLPAGFTYVDSTIPVSQVTDNGNTITFTLFGETSFDYTVIASSIDGTYAFSGTIKDFDKAVSTIGGDISIVVVTEPVGEPGESVDALSARTLPTTSVEPDAEFTVSMTADDYGLAGTIVETIPVGFTYVDSTMDASQVATDGNTVTFTLIGESSFDYTVAASSTEDTYAFSGVLTDFDKTASAVDGDTSITVEAVPEEAGPDALAVRALPATSVEPNAEFTVSMTVADYGLAGLVVETIPLGCTFVDSTLDASQVGEAGNVVTFTLIGESSFDYTVAASDTDGTYAFSGIIKDFDAVEFAVSGDTSVEVVTPAPPAPPALATRTLPTDPIESGTEFTVSMTAADYGPVESLVETLPTGFAYVSSTLDASQVAVSGDTVTFTLVDESGFDYTVTASDTAGTYALSGVVKNSDMIGYAVSGDTSIEVFVPVVNDLPLEAGWNFISVPKALADSSADSVLTGVAYDALVSYDAENRLWIAVSTFEPLKGYWINVSATDQVILEHALVAKQAGDNSIPASVQLYEGWNAVGSNYESVETAEKVLMSVDGSYSKIADKYGVIGLNGKYEDGIDGTENFMMDPYEGYWVFVTQNDELA